jgi:hypothetical protein
MARPTSGNAMFRMEKSTDSMKLVPRRSTAISRCRAVIATVRFARASVDFRRRIPTSLWADLRELHVPLPGHAFRRMASSAAAP